jgi:hypothetical protein
MVSAKEGKTQEGKILTKHHNTQNWASTKTFSEQITSAHAFQRMDD